MEARIIHQIHISWNSNRFFCRRPLDFSRFIRASSSTSQVLVPFLLFSEFSFLSLSFYFKKIFEFLGQQKTRSYRGPKPSKNLVADFISRNDELVRSLPIYVGGASLLAVLFNRTVSGIAPVADASSTQSRADLLAIGLAVTNLLTGLVWLSIRPKTITPVQPEGVNCKVVQSDLPASMVSELLWAWESLKAATCCKSLVIVYSGVCLIQIGMIAESQEDSKAVTVNTDKLMEGSVYQGVMKSKAQSYLANLSLYPGRSELPFLPSNTQAVILQPLGDKGIAVIGGNTIRGFTSSDQAWISSIGEKLDATLGRYSNSDEIPRVSN